VDLTPAAGAEVAVDVVVSATFDVPVAPTDDYALVITNVDGTTALAPDGLSMTWSGTLAPDTTYTLSATVCTDERQITFSTAPPPVDLLSLEGRTFVLPWASVDVTEPPQGDALSAQLNIDYLLAQIVAVDEASGTATTVGTAGYATDAKGDLLKSPLPECSTVGEDSVADFSANPVFTISGTIQFVVAPETGDIATLEDFVLTGIMVEGGSTIRNPQLSGKLASESLGLLDGRPCSDPVVQFFGTTCVPCDSSPNKECMLIEANAPEAYYDPSVDVVGTCGL
jgi:hypothetical protein